MPHSFIKNNLLVEVSSTRFAARAFLWVLRRHSLVSYSLYMAGGWGEEGGVHAGGLQKGHAFCKQLQLHG